MKNVAFCINHNIAIVSILNLQNITNQTISSQRLTEIQSRLLKTFGPLTAKLISKIVNKPCIPTSQLLLNPTYGHTILNILKYSALLASANNLIRFEPQIKFLFLENGINLTNQLDSKLILSDFIIRLDHNAK